MFSQSFPFEHQIITNATDLNISIRGSDNNNNNNDYANVKLSATLEKVKIKAVNIVDSVSLNAYVCKHIYMNGYTHVWVDSIQSGRNIYGEYNNNKFVNLQTR